MSTPSDFTSSAMMRIEITGTGGDFDGKKGWVQQLIARSIFDVAYMKANGLTTGMWLVVWEDGSTNSFADFASMWETLYEGQFLLLP